MWRLKGLSTEAWRRTGAINVLLISAYGLGLLACLLTSAFIPPAKSIFGARNIYDANCDSAKALNLVLHLLINCFSTGLLASANFFMQVVSSPSRHEVDQAHRFLCTLEIGVPSTKNIFFLSRFKSVAWVLLFLSSVPIHLFFNSAVYETNYEGTDWQLTLATEAFVQQSGGYYSPGASLAVSGAWVPASWQNYDTDEGYNYNSGYGSGLSLESYWTASSTTAGNITKANTNAVNWQRLDSAECFAEYKFCKARKQYRDVVVVLNTTGDSGWMRSQVFDFDPSSNLSSIWDSHVPPNATNSLWFSASCSIKMDFYGTGNTCLGGCAGALGDPSGNSWVNTTSLPSSGWTFAFRPYDAYLPAVYGFNESFDNFDVAYCLAEPSPDYKCKIGVSNALLAVVILCVLVKLLVCIIILWKLPSATLVTPGDAIQSFISKPDKRTFALGPIDVTDSHRLEYARRLPRSAMDVALDPKPRRWHSRPRRFMDVVTRAVWVRTYGLLLIGLGLLLTALVFIAITDGVSSMKTSFGTSDNNFTTSLAGNNPTYLGALLTANSAQLVLSLCYFAFNAFFTRLGAESEWSSYSLAYRPLRVSWPSGGKQVSTYRLQLPYMWSVPLLGISILLHWILSNALFIFVIEGGFWTGNDGADLSRDNLGVSADARGALGFSPPAVLALFLTSTVLCFIPLVLSRRRVPGTIVTGGTNSLVLSAACHCAVLARPRQTKTATQTDSVPDTGKSEITSSSAEDRSAISTNEASDLKPPVLPAEQEAQEVAKPLLDGMTAEEQEQYELSLLRELTLSEVRWGAIPADPNLVHAFGLEGDETVMHLGFGSEEDKVTPPKDGHLYI